MDRSGLQGCFNGRFVGCFHQVLALKGGIQAVMRTWNVNRVQTLLNRVLGLAGLTRSAPRHVHPKRFFYVLLTSPHLISL